MPEPSNLILSYSCTDSIAFARWCQVELWRHLGGRGIREQSGKVAGGSDQFSLVRCLLYRAGSSGGWRGRGTEPGVEALLEPGQRVDPGTADQKIPM